MSDHRIDLKNLDKKITALSDALAKLGSADDLRKLLLLIKHPGWTTPAEFLFTVSIVDSMTHQVEGLARLQGELLRAGEAVGAKVAQ
jgi:hypothetical protein